MQRLFVSLAVVVLGCLAVPAKAQDVVDYKNRGDDWFNKGEYDMAIANYDQALRLLDPSDAANIAAVYSNRADAWEKKGEYDKAIADCNQALVVNPSFFYAYNNRAIAWNEKGEYDKAIADCNQALAINPSNADAYCNRGFAWQGKGEYDKAIADYNQALAVNPNLVEAYNGLASLQATCPDARYRDGKKAFENASKGYQLSGGEYSSLDALAAAYAECGDFDAAKDWEEKAIESAKADKSVDKDKAEYPSHLESYKQRKPWREELKKK